MLLTYSASSTGHTYRAINSRTVREGGRGGELVKHVDSWRTDSCFYVHCLSVYTYDINDTFDNSKVFSLLSNNFNANRVDRLLNFYCRFYVV